MEFTSGYVQRALDRLPKRGSRAPWKLRQNYLFDILTLRYGSIADEAMEFSPLPERPARADKRVVSVEPSCATDGELSEGG